MKVTQRVRKILSWYESDNPGTKTNLARILMTDKLAGTGKMVITIEFVQRLGESGPRIFCLSDRREPAIIRDLREDPNHPLEGEQREILIDDLPAELRPANADAAVAGDWEAALASWAAQLLADGGERVLDEALPKFERTMIVAAMNAAGGKRKAAAELLGWGRNTLTRKIDELHLGNRFRD